MRSALAPLLLVACNEIGGTFDASEPDAQSIAIAIEPEVLLDFGAVPSDGERSQDITVTSIGGAPLVIESIELSAGSSAKWRHRADEALFTGLLPGEQATIRVWLRPCPEAWTGEQIDPNVDRSECYGRIAAGALEIMSNAGRRTISLSGRGEEPPQQVHAEPQAGLHFSWKADFPERSWIWINMTNTGHADLLVDEIEIVQDQNYFRFYDGCANRCPVRFVICPFAREGCATPLLSVAVNFYPPPTGEVEPGRIVIRSNDPNTPELVLPLDASANGCTLPSVRLSETRFSSRAGRAITLAPALMSPGLTAYRWEWVYSATTAPPLTGSDQRVVSFIPMVPGSYAIGLRGESECGVTPAPNIAVIDVFDG